MKLISKVLHLIVALVFSLTGCRTSPHTTAQVDPTATTSSSPTTHIPTTTFTPMPPSRPLFLAHYMPWYQAPPTSNSWGWHWTMNHFDPNQKDSSGRPQIASRYTPLTGPYDSSDPDLLEYQVLLLKLSGIDGVIVDWYSMVDFRDYGLLNQSTIRLFKVIKKAGLSFAICYEDQAVKHMVEEKVLPEKDIYTHTQEEMAYLQSNWFTDPTYLKISGRPLLLNFGPQYFINPADWQMIFSGLDPKPLFILLDRSLPSVGAGGFAWPPMGASQDMVLSQAALESYLNDFYQRAENWQYVVSGAFPGFDDVYKEAGVEPQHRFLDSRQGETFSYTLQKALDNHPDAVQLITWNDYGEGTNIEPTNEYGYRYLEMVQEARVKLEDSFPFTSGDLRLPLRLFKLRKQHAGDAGANARLDQASQAILSGDITAAEKILSEYP